MATSRGNTESFQNEIRTEMNDMLSRLGRSIGRRLLRKGYSQHQAFLKVADALVEFEKCRPEIESPDRWLVEHLGLGPYKAEVYAKELAEEQYEAVHGKRVKALDIRIMEDIERRLQLFLDERKKAGPSAPDKLDPNVPWELWEPWDFLATPPRTPGS
jgi:hypothetical protein